MKKLISIFLSITILISAIGSFSFTAQAADTVASGTCGASGYTLNWSLDSEGVMTISGSGQRMADYSTTSSKRAPWYSSYRTQIKRLVIENGVINIGAYAFADCTSLEEIEFGTIDTLGNNAFDGCTALKHAILPDSCTWLWTSAFKGCTALQSAYINACNSYSGCIPSDFFNGCTSLAAVGLGESVSTFNSNCFNGCSSLTAILVGGSSLSIANSNAFKGVTKANCYLVSGNTNIQSFANSNGFAYESSTSGICSDNTYSLTQLTYSFDLKTSTLSFSGSGDMNFYENGTQPWQKFIGAVNTVSFADTDAKSSISTTAFQGRETIVNADFTNIYAVGWGAFAECSNLGNLQFDSELNQIWNYAFANCTGVSEIRFTEGTDELHIYPYAFNNCTGTTYWINLPKNTRYIDANAFWACKFNYVTIASENVTIGTDAFGDGTGGYARFMGVGSMDTGVYSWVKEARSSGYSWYYYCIDDAHSYTNTAVAPTCTEQGYDLYSCPYCDADSVKSNYTNPLGHLYKYTDTNGASFIYECTRCGANNLELTAVETVNYFQDSVSRVAGEQKFKQFNYDGRADVNADGVINAKDLKLINDAINSPDLTDKETVIDPSTAYQTIEGFGASAAWWSQTVGNWENAEDIISMLYSPTDGIGLNIYRYNLGAGSRDINDTTMYIDDARTNCFLQADGTYSWDNDAGAMNALSIADSLNSNLKVTLFSNSAPVYMTENGKAYLTPDTTSNLSSANYQAFADFVAKCAEHFIDEGYNVTAVSPINEPEWGWTGWYNADSSVSCNQEGCHWDYTQARDFYNNYMIPAITSNSKLNGKVGVSVWESGQMDNSNYWDNFLNNCFSNETKTIGIFGNNYASSNANIRNYVDTVDVHSYWADENSRSNVASDLSGEHFGQKIRCTEYCQMDNDYNAGVVAHIKAEGGSTNGMTIDYGLAMADVIYQDLTIENAIEWDWWTACGRGVYTDSLIYVNDNDHSYQTAKRLWCLGNYSKFIDEGAKRISVSTGSALGSNLNTSEENIYTWTDEYGNVVTDKNNYLEQSAYLNPDGTVAVVYINNSDTTEYTTFDISQFSTFTSYVTDASRDLAKFQSGKASDAVCIPAKSVTTVVLTQGGTPAVSADGAYLFTYFTGNSVDEQTVHFAVSADGYHFTPLKGNNAVIRQTLGTNCCRDPYIFKGQDGYYYIVATDMDASANVWWGNSVSMVYWRSKDLVNWSDETIIDMRNILPGNDIQRCWAPQVIWDDKEQKYLVYFGLASDSYTGSGTYLYYCYTDNLLDENSYSKPELLFKPTDGGAAIDGDIIYDSKKETYYLYYKDETNATICYVTSKNITGPYSDPSNPTKVINTDVGLEGCNSYFITGTDTLVMLADAYGSGYFVMNQSTDFKNFYSLNDSDYTINNCSPRHGSVIAISSDEYNTLVNSIGY